MRSDIPLDHLVLTVASPEQWRETQVHQTKLWGGGLSVNDYKKRETALCLESDFAKKGEFTGW